MACEGDQNLFSSLHGDLVQRLPLEPVEWRRSYGRPPRMVQVEANFVPFTDEMLPKEGDMSLLRQPFFHMFWTDCPDVDVYKIQTKDEITLWLQKLRIYNIQDWMIVLVANSDAKKNKLLPRTTVIDKIKSDFCSKQADRCLVIYDPLTDSPKSLESWVALVQRLKQLLLVSFNRNLGQFEDNMRAQRERRTEVDWNFCRYFLVQEELAFVFEMLKQYEDALVQYDELDALFTQFVLNIQAGDIPEWLGSFSRPCTCWDGLYLWQPVNYDKRDLIQENTATLLDLRNYLFSRQCALLFFLQRPWEVAQRTLPFVHNVIRELEILELTLPAGAVACWAFMSCLEVLQMIERCSDSSQVEAYSPYTASIWAYAREKLHELGVMCGLMPDMTPSSEQLHMVVDLLAGMGQKPEKESIPNSPDKKLREALSSKAAFQKHYLELSELAMGTYKHIGRIRSARRIGKDLAAFYMMLGDARKAESFLSDALKMYQREGWGLLATNTCKDLAFCQKELNNMQKYAESCSLLASNDLLSPADRTHFYTELLSVCGKSAGGDSSLLLHMEPMMTITDVCIDSEKRHPILGSNVHITLHMQSSFSEDMSFDKVTLVLQRELREPSVTSQSEEKPAELGGDKPTSDPPRFHKRSVSVGCMSSLRGWNGQAASNQIPSYLNVQAECQVKPDGSLNLSGINCPSASQFLSCVRLKLTGHFLPSPQVLYPQLPESPSKLSNDKEDQMIPSYLNVQAECQVKPDGSLNWSGINCPSSSLQWHNITRFYIPSYLNVQAECQVKPDGSLNWSGINCPSASQFLRRQDSSHSLVKGQEVVKEEGDLNLEVGNITLKPGDNKICFSTTVESRGLFTVRQLVLRLSSAEFVSSRIWPPSSYEVASQNPTVTLTPLQDLLAGIPQQIQVTVCTGDHVLPQDTTIGFSTTPQLTLQAPQDRHGKVTKQDAGEGRVQRSLNRIQVTKFESRVVSVNFFSSTAEDESPDDVEYQSEEDGGCLVLKLPTVEAYHRLQLTVWATAEIPDLGLAGQEGDATNVEHKVSFKSPLVKDEPETTFIFHYPFLAKNQLHTAGDSKFVHVEVVGLSSAKFDLQNPDLSISDLQDSDTAVRLTPLHQDSPMIVYKDQTVSYLWQLHPEELQGLPQLSCRFSLQYCLQGSQQQTPYNYSFTMNSFKTLYQVETSVETPTGSEKCQTLYQVETTVETPTGCEKCQTLYQVETSVETPTGSEKCQTLYQVETTVETPTGSEKCQTLYQVETTVETPTGSEKCQTLYQVETTVETPTGSEKCQTLYQVETTVETPTGSKKCQTLYQVETTVETPTGSEKCQTLYQVETTVETPTGSEKCQTLYQVETTVETPTGSEKCQTLYQVETTVETPTGSEKCQTLYQVETTVETPTGSEKCQAGVLCHRFQTLYQVETTVETPTGSEKCQAGVLCPLRLLITSTSQPVDRQDTDSVPLMYEVLADNTMWAVCGKSSGVVSMPTATMTTKEVLLEVMPLIGGYLPVPVVQLSQYQELPSPDNNELSPGTVRPSPDSVERSPDDSHPGQVYFGHGQVYSCSQAQQVHVLPANNGGNLVITFQ
ncbi:trafficking protein particle complex subunit 10-like [Branchiostoma floridae]|uniref:Trafficking protein particle complex subunit 10-like n=1 Tax=Branchiostoma floridae TaxID=7739 RepID=A0A9J7LPP0_BRAFL|nr:trafficking protein particle complex subunit 10-like [Branchiostoma floridae]